MAHQVVTVRSSPILMKNSDLSTTPNFACPLSSIAHLRYEGIAIQAENLALGARRAFQLASGVVAPLQNEIVRTPTQPRDRVFHQYSPKTAARNPLVGVDRHERGHAVGWAATNILDGGNPLRRACLS
jgi:hypothetical protein